MGDPVDLAALEQESFIACYRALAEGAPRGAVRECGGIFAFVTGTPVPMFNGCVVADPDWAGELPEALTWLSGQDVPFTLWTPGFDDPDLDALAARHGLAREQHPYPGMVLTPVPSRPALPPGLVVEPAVAGREADFAAVVVSGGLGAEAAALLTGPAFADRADVDLFVGYLDGSPVGTSIAISSARVGGVVSVLTVAEARGRGVGTALTWAAVEAGRVRGHEVVALQATPMGLPVYRAMGFATVLEHAEYT